MTISSFATPETPVPDAVRRLAGESEPRPVWVNGSGGATFELAGPPRRFVKWQPAGSGDAPLRDEAARLRWAGAYAKVPQVVEIGASPDGSWMVTEAINGESAVVQRWKDDPETAARSTGAALRELHDALPVADCPFDWSVELRLSQARASGVPSSRLEVSVPSVDQLVVCQGDACVPNTLLFADGRLAAHLDLGCLGVADRWADLAVATWSVDWNYGARWEAAYLDGYGIARDEERIEFYRYVWDLAHPV